MITSGIGRIVHDPKLVQVGNTEKVELVISIKEKRRGKEGKNINDTHYLNFEAWDAAAGFIIDMARKGDWIFVEASPRQERWEKDGKKMSRQYFRLTNFKIFPQFDNEVDNSDTEGE